MVTGFQTGESGCGSCGDSRRVQADGEAGEAGRGQAAGQETTGGSEQRGDGLD